MSLLQVENLSLHFHTRRKRSPVLRKVNLTVETGQVCALVGESGAGKSILAKTILGLLPGTIKVDSGSILFNQQDLLSLKPRALRRLIGHDIALIPQDPMLSLNPVKRIGRQLADGMQLHLGLNASTARDRSLHWLHEVSLRDPERVLHAYAHELSGGMRQRVLIAMAFSCEPALIIADEPTTALDVTVQKTVLALIRRLQQKQNTSVLFVTHDLGVVARISDRIAVMFDGRILEDRAAASLFKQPAHPYTAALLDAMPRYDQPDKLVLPVPAELLQRLTEETQRLDQGN